jgi:hypothetical protein
MAEFKINGLGNRHPLNNKPIHNKSLKALHESQIMLRGKAFTAEYKNYPIFIKAGNTYLKIIKNNFIINNRHVFASAYMLIQKPGFNENDPASNSQYFKCLWENEPVEIGASCKDARRFILDPTVAPRHFSVLGCGNRFTIKDLCPLQGTIVKTLTDDTENAFNSQYTTEIVTKNVERILSEDFRQVLNQESMGGNAGPGNAAVHGYADQNGLIMYFGNCQEVPETIRNNDKLFDIYFRVKMVGTFEGPKYESLPFIYSDRLSEILRMTAAEASKRDNKPEFRFMHS